MSNLAKARHGFIYSLQSSYEVHWILAVHHASVHDALRLIRVKMDLALGL